MRAPKKLTSIPESDRVEGAPHPRETLTLCGHDAAEQTLLDAYRSGRMPQAVILGGPEGVGKATLAWRLARFIVANPDPASAAVAAANDLSVPGNNPATLRIAALGQPDLALLRRGWNERSKRPFKIGRAHV